MYIIWKLEVHLELCMTDDLTDDLKFSYFAQILNIFTISQSKYLWLRDSDELVSVDLSHTHAFNQLDIYKNVTCETLQATWVNKASNAHNKYELGTIRRDIWNMPGKVTYWTLVHRKLGTHNINLPIIFQYTDFK